MFLLVPAHPGFPGQIPQSRKTVVCCVCVGVILTEQFCSNRTQTSELKMAITVVCISWSYDVSNVTSAAQTYVSENVAH